MTPKVQSILSYLGILWLIAYFVGKEQRDSFSIYHLKQGLGLLVLAILFNIAVYVLSIFSATLGVLVSYAGILFFIIMIVGIINVANEVKKPLPVIGKLFEDKFDFIDKK